MSLGEPGERLRSGWCNLYLQGWYHRAGKAGTMTLHPGDLYPSKEAALADIDPAAPYVGTALVQWVHPKGAEEPAVFPEGSAPVPLSVSRKWDVRSLELGSMAAIPPQQAMAAILVGQENPEARPDFYRLAQEQFIRESGMDSLDTSVREAVQPPKAYKPAHGGYPAAGVMP